MRETSIIYAIRNNTLFKLGTFSNKNAVKILNDQEVIRQHGPLVAIRTDNGTILQYITVDIIDHSTLKHIATEYFFDHDTARHYSFVMANKGYITNIH